MLRSMDVFVILGTCWNAWDEDEDERMGGRGGRIVLAEGCEDAW